MILCRSHYMCALLLPANTNFAFFILFLTKVIFDTYLLKWQLPFPGCSQIASNSWTLMPCLSWVKLCSILMLVDDQIFGLREWWLYAPTCGWEEIMMMVMMMTTIKLNRQNYQNLCNISHWSNNQKELDVIGKFWCSWLKIMSKAMTD